MHLIVLVLLFITSHAFAQDSSELNYAPISSLDETWLKREVRIDIKSPHGITPEHSGNMREILLSNDTLELIVNKDRVIFIEGWDNSSEKLEDQLLVTTSGWIIREQIIFSMNDETIIIKVKAYKRNQGNLEYGATEVFSVPRSSLNGVFYANH